MKRANDYTQKQVRRRVILQSALSLFEEAGGQLSTVAAIAERSKIAKGTVYLYFKTREAIYLALLEEFINGWFDAIETAGDGSAGMMDIVNLSCSYIEARPVFMGLASIFNGILEKNINYETAYSFKVNLRDRVFLTGGIIATQFSEISHEMAIKLILRSFALSIGLWQIAEPAPILKQLLKKDELKLLKIDFLSELRDGLFTMWNETLRVHSNK